MFNLKLHFWFPLVASSILFSSTAFALQIKSVVDNETVTAKISSLDVTRILVEGDRIKSVRGVKGAYTHENDEINGEIFIQPTPFYQDRGFTTLIETEQGRHFTLLLNPIPVPSDTLMLVPKGVGKFKAGKFEKANNYESMLANLMREMTNDSIPDGYSVREIDSKKIYAIGNIATLSLKTIYEGLKYQGEIYTLTNTQSYPITLDERTFFKIGTRAVSLENITVPAHNTIRVLRVVSHD